MPVRGNAAKKDYMMLTNMEILSTVNEAILEAESFGAYIDEKSKRDSVTAKEWVWQCQLNLEIARLKMLAEIAVRLGSISEKIEGV
jgi:hypothetical protein